MLLPLGSTSFFLLFPLSIFAQSSTAPLANPTSVPCPADLALVRSAGVSTNQSLSPAEKNYISVRASDVLPGAWKAYLANINSTSPTTLPNYVSNILTNTSNGAFPRLGIAVSGGGYRAALFGAGVLSSLDGRNTTAASRTGTGGLLQAASYLSAISGGSWLVTALAQANFPTIADLIFPPPSEASARGRNALFGGFNAQIDLIAPGSNANATLAYLQMLIGEVKAKHDASGFPITVTDPWSRGIARHFINGSTAQNIVQSGAHGAGVLFSDITKLPSFMSHKQPFPIIVADTFSPNPNATELLPGATVPLTNEIWEFNVFETGSFDPMLASFTPTSLLGSTNSSHCVAGFDQAAFIAGVSSDVFPQSNTSEATLQASPFGLLVALINSTFPNQGVRLDAAVVPNPFKGVNPATYSNTNEEFVTMLDGGLDGEVIPLQPLLVRARGVDTIIAIDADDDNEFHFANGTELIASAKRAALFGTTYPFPAIPSTPDIFVQQNLTRRPTFFGCNDSTDTPLVIYIMNGGPPGNGASPVTNTTTAQTKYSPQQVRSFLDQAFDIATQGAPSTTNGTDPAWGTCLACAVVDRARARSGAQREGVCADCLQRYCWDGNGTAIQPGSSGSGNGGGSTGKNAARKTMPGSMSWASIAALSIGLAIIYRI